MAKFNASDRVIECKIVYCGPGRCGKTTNLEYINRAFKRNITSELVSINNQGEQTLIFDYLPMGIRKIKGCEVKIKLFAVPGQEKYSSTRKMVLKHVDGVVFVADSLNVQRRENLRSMRDLQRNLSELDISIFEIQQALFVVPGLYCGL